MKNGLRKSRVRLTKQHLNELTFAINSTTSSEGTGSPAERFFGRSVRSRLPNSINPEIKSSELIKRRIQKHDARIKNKNKTNKILYEVGQRVRLQNIATRDWDLKGTIDKLRIADDGRVLSYDVFTDKNHMTTRHRRYLKPLHKEHDPKIPKNDTDNVDTANDAIIQNADLPEQNVDSVAPRRSSRRSVGSLETAKVVRMGSEQSKPINATIELCIEAGEDKLRIEAGEVRHNGARGALNNSGTGNKGQITNMRCSNGARRDGNCAGSGSMNVTRYGQSYGRLNRTQIGSDRPNGSLGLGSVHKTQGMEARGSGAGGPMRMRQSAGVSET